MTARVVVSLDGLPLPSRANLREHWAVRAKRDRTQRLIAASHLRHVLPPGVRARLLRGGRLAVTITRLAPRRLDDDNLAAACKAVRDGIADALGVDDRDPRIVWRPAQIARTGRPSVVIALEALEAV